MALPLALETLEAPSQDERRAHIRHGAAALPWISVSRLRNGPSVSLIDLSVGGVLLEADVPLRPGARLTLEIAGQGDQPAIAPMHALRCEIAMLDRTTARYRGACEFVRPLELPALMAKPQPDPTTQRFMTLDASLKMLVDRYRRDPGGTLDIPDVVRVLANARRPGIDGGRRRLARQAARGFAADGRHCTRARGQPAPCLAAIESRLRVALPQVDVRLTDGPLPPTGSGAEMILFRPDRLTDLGCVLNVEMPHGSTLDDWQFRLLRSSMHLCSLFDASAVPDVTEPAATALWQRVVVRYMNGRLIKGFCRDFNPSQSEFSVWPAPHAPESERLMLNVEGLKAVFFVRDFGGDSAYVEEKVFDRPSHGRGVEVTFYDDEVIVGTTLGYRADTPTFSQPGRSQGEQPSRVRAHERVRHVRFLGNATEAINRIDESSRPSGSAPPSAFFRFRQSTESPLWLAGRNRAYS